MLFPTTIAGSLPKPEWLAEPNTLWAPWKSSGDELARAKRDATVLAIKLQEDAGVDIVTEGEQARQHFVHGFLEKIEGIDFAHKVEMGIRKDRYKAMVPQVVAPLQLKSRVHEAEARVARANSAPDDFQGAHSVFGSASHSGFGKEPAIVVGNSMRASRLVWLRVQKFSSVLL